ncbi:MAG TPA: 4-hydroxy-tetrahydrodipicolinate reductase [Acidimicrobiales bacterium]|nr:4-hydroxy-tetrahydrodipicolinate reductase [Acidimicrobiales bacterium]
MAIRVGVFGAGGRMGATVCQAVVDDPELELVAAVDPQHAGLDLQEVTKCDVPGVQIARDPEGMGHADVEVAVDFTHVDAARQNLAWLARNDIHAVVGTTGFTEADYDALGKSFTGSNCVIAPNFAVGAVLMMRFAELAAPYFETGEVVELHHDGKVDAPSGTAVLTVQRMAAASDQWGADPTTEESLEGARGAQGPNGIRVHAIRMRGMVASQEVILGTTGQTLTIRHDTTDRTSFMPGVVLAVKRVADHPGLTVGLDSLLGL